ncbi:MAG: hypothetical protein HY343_06680 [Lentisphaerae bacterium]|nr:hypothetical protein [Lentisphaerota bacterium]
MLKSRRWLLFQIVGCIGITLSAALAQTSEPPAKMTRLLDKLAKGEQVTIVALGDSNTELTFQSRKILALGKELNVPVVDHYSSWMRADASHAGPLATNPNKLWLRMSDATHPGPAGHLAFYRDLAPWFDLPDKLSWEF